MKIMAQAFLSKGRLLVTAGGGGGLRGAVVVGGTTRHLTIGRSLPAANFFGGGDEIAPRLSSSPAAAVPVVINAKSELIRILSREADEELASANLDMPSALEDLKNDLEKDWKIVPEGGTTHLFRKEKKVQISFHCQNTVSSDDDIERLMEKYEDYDNHVELEDEDLEEYVRFCVTVSKAGKTLVINCVSEQGKPTIDRVFTTTTAPDAIHANRGKPTEISHCQGPEFDELDEDLKKAFKRYLKKECGVNSDMAAFVAMYSDYREQLQYVQFLKDVPPIIS